MKTSRLHLVLLGVAALFVWGCGYEQTSEVTPKTDSPADTAGQGEGMAMVSTVICGKCGELKGTDECCAAGAEKCADCAMIKGSNLCCVEIAEELKGKDFCTKCGEVAGSETCCAKDAEVCTKCNLHKGSPMCCKLKPAGDAGK